MKKLFLLTAIVAPLLITNVAQAANNWEVRRLKNGSCGVAELKPGAKPGSNRVAGPYASRSKANKELTRLKTSPRCKRF